MHTLKELVKLAQNDANYFYLVGRAYLEGTHGVKKDTHMACVYFERGCTRGYEKKQQYKNLYGHGLTWYRQIEKDPPYYKKKALEYFNKAFDGLLKEAKAGDKLSQQMIGNYYYFGDMGQAKDIAAANMWWQKAADLGCYFAQNNLAGSYQNGEGVEKDLNKAIELFRKSAEQCNTSAVGGLAETMKLTDKNVDETEISKLYENAAKHGCCEAMYWTAVRYERAVGVAKNHDTALYWYGKSAKQGFEKAQYKLGGLYSK